jgi:hypothetical protein
LQHLPGSQSESHKQTSWHSLPSMQVHPGGQLSVGGMLMHGPPSGCAVLNTHIPLRVSANRSTSQCIPNSGEQPLLRMGSQTAIGFDTQPLGLLASPAFGARASALPVAPASGVGLLAASAFATGGGFGWLIDPA